MKERRYILKTLADMVRRRVRADTPVDRAAVEAYEDARKRVRLAKDCRDVADTLATLGAAAALDRTQSRDTREGLASGYAIAAELCRNAYGGR